MRSCTYCGRKNEATLTRCYECGTPLVAEEAGKAAVSETEKIAVPLPPVLNLHTLQQAFDFREGFSRPNWEYITREIEAIAGTEEMDRAWDEAVLQWTDKLAKELGGGYRTLRAGGCVLLSNLEMDVAERLLSFSESAVLKIGDYLPNIAWGEFRGLHVILVFSEDDDYYQYISDFFPEGLHPASSGVHLHKDYAHMACMHVNESASAQTILHELVHHSLHHLEIPRWLHEGLAMTIERSASRSRTPLLADDLPERHHQFWDEKWIQRFWAGISFGEVDEPMELSYSLSEVLLHLLAKDREDFLAFVQTAHYSDGGQTAALDFLGMSLGDAAGTFLGPGNWRPQRKAIKECWEEAKQKSGA